MKPPGTTLKFHEFPEYYNWNRKLRKWIRHTKKKQIYTIGRMPRLDPKHGEIYFLRLLLLDAVGIECWDDLYKYKDKRYKSFKDVCIARGLLEHDDEWKRCMTDAACWQTGDQLLALFVTILIHCNPADPRKLWNEFKQQIGESIEHRLKAKTMPNTNIIISSELVDNLTLKEINKRLKMHKKTLQDFNLPSFKKNQYLDVEDEFALELMMEKNYDQHHQNQIVETNVALMNTQQKTFYNLVKDAINGNNKQKLFFLDALGGTGKTFIAKTLLAYVRGQAEIAVAIAFSGIAALILPGGRTVHSRFNLPIEFNNTSIGDISHNSITAKILREAKLIIWDEAPMAHKEVLECVDRTLKDIMSNNEPFGGKIIVFSGDFRQILPVCPKSSRAQIVAAALNRSNLWKYIKVYHLTENERVKSAGKKELKEFAEILAKIGDGKFKIEKEIGTDMIRIPEAWLSRCLNLEDFVEEAFPNIAYNYNKIQYLQGRAILTPKNCDAKKLMK